jgi:hypothetical protein
VIYERMNRRQFAKKVGLLSSMLMLPGHNVRLPSPAITDVGSSPPIYYDKWELIVQKGMDGGDTAQREGWYWFGTWIRCHVLNNLWTVPRNLTFNEVINLLEPGHDGVFYRHPKLPPWNDPYSSEWGFSRDQMIPLVAAMGIYGLTDEVRRLWNALPQDVVGGTKHTYNGRWITVLGQKTVYTGDIVVWSTVNLFKRAWGENPSSAQDGEINLLEGVRLRLVQAKDPDNTGDDLNLIVMLLMSILRFPTATSGEAVKVYKNRPNSYGSYLGAYRQRYGVDLSVSAAEMKRRMDDGIASGWGKDASAVYGAVRWYHREETGANPQLAELYAPIIEKYLT